MDGFHRALLIAQDPPTAARHCRGIKGFTYWFKGRSRANHGFEMFQTSKSKRACRIWQYGSTPQKQVEFESGDLLLHRLENYPHGTLATRPLPNRLPALVHRVQDSLVCTSFQQLGLPLLQAARIQEPAETHWNEGNFLPGWPKCALPKSPGWVLWVVVGGSSHLPSLKYTYE